MRYEENSTATSLVHKARSEDDQQAGLGCNQIKSGVAAQIFSPRIDVKQFGNEKTNQLSPRSAAKPPKPRRIVKPALVPITASAAAGDSPGHCENLTPRRKLEKLDRFRLREADVESDVSQEALTPTSSKRKLEKLGRFRVRDFETGSDVSTAVVSEC